MKQHSISSVSILAGVFLMTCHFLDGTPDKLDRSQWKSDEEIDSLYGDSASERGAKAQRNALTDWEIKIAGSGSMPKNESIPMLGSAISKLSKYNIYQIPERIRTYDLAREKLLAIPGHARYFADEIKREQKEVAPYPTSTGPRVSYDRQRSWYFQTLAHLPSPETIAMLGDFLSDDIDTPRPLMTPGSDWGPNPRANSFSASYIISTIGLRNPPMAAGAYDADPDAHLAKTRAWWEQVKSGELPFSFVGELVEYRFKPDGSVESSSLPTSVLARDPKPVPTADITPASKGSDNGNRWWWIGGGILAALAGWAWLRRKARAPN